MFIVQIEHPVFEFTAWKQAFDSDPANRQQAGVRSYQILQPLDDPNYVIIDLAFNTVGEAEAFLLTMRNVWKRAEGTIMVNAQELIVEIVESATC